jgi:hypothetical protein
MYQSVPLYRVVSFGQAKGPWRLERVQAQNDAVDEGLGSFDEYGQFWITVPGDIEVMVLPMRLIEAALAQRAPDRRAA